MNNLDYDDIYGYDEPQYIKQEDRYDKVRGLMDDLIVELYGTLKSNWDLSEIHNIVSCLAGEMDLYIPEESLKIARIA